MDDKGKRKEYLALEPLEFGLLRNWNPVREWGLGRLFEESPAERRAFRWSPASEVAENDNAYVVTVELPGTKREDVQLEIHENVLTIHGEKKSEREEKNEKRHYVERSYGSFTRSFSLPPNTEAERIKASFKDGVLTVKVPKTEVAKPRVIDIKS